MSLKTKLSRFQSYLKHETKENVQPKPMEHDVTIPFFERWREEGTYPYFCEDGYCLIKEKKIPLHFKRGPYFYHQFFHAISLWNESKVDHPLSAKGYSANDLFFFDTETTGLSRGAGNTIFILGTAFFTNDEIVVKQYILPNPSGEVALYDSFLNDVNYETLVTFNGKSFDWPQVKTRHTLVREQVPKLPSFGHFDLYHASRRMWKGELESLKLSNIERNILGIKRENDLPGHLAPLIYFDFLERKDPEGMFKVLKHNEDDLLSLITLYIHLTYKLLQNDSQMTPREQLAVGKWFSSVKEHHYAIEVYENAVQHALGYDKWKGFHQLAFQYKKNKNYDQALSIWLDIHHQLEGIEKIEAHVEAAKILEHKKKDFNNAYEIVLKAIHYLSEKKGQDKKWENLESALLKRMERLQTKRTH